MHSVITRKGQVTIPKEIRDHLKAKEGEKVAFVLRGDDVILRMVRGNILDLKEGRHRQQDCDDPEYAAPDLFRSAIDSQSPRFVFARINPEADYFRRT